MQATDAVIAKRADSGAVETDEIRALAEAAGYDIVAELTQTRAEHPGLQFGRGKVEELSETVAETSASVVIFDNELTPGQTFGLANSCPDGTEILDRRRLVLDIFEEQAGSKRAKLQVKRAQLAHDLPRIREEITRERAGELLAHDEKGGQRVRDVERRIEALDAELADLTEDEENRRQRRREEGFEFVALAGYTNAGKSTLLHRLADDLEFENREADHGDIDATAEIEDRLFKTLDTTTRRATIDGRRTLVTDTVGFVDDLPHDLVASFHDTLSESETADCAILVADASDPPDELRRKLETSADLLADAEGEVVTVLNKADLCSEEELEARREAIGEISADPIAVSATEGRNLDALRDRIAAALPERRDAELALPNDDEAMSLVSWLYDRASVEDVNYTDSEVRIAFAGPESVVERARGRAEKLSSEP
ncbi:GTPase HflX [Halorussus amylolyticus]|uniref:GTPase HflX n=1 Tax=Halorussus amylolyticus TaxID=1126242 RepID=UPI001048557F|nr:GTPase HflX [Halorussus amylolyticus]